MFRQLLHSSVSFEPSNYPCPPKTGTIGESLEYIVDLLHRDTSICREVFTGKGMAGLLFIHAQIIYNGKPVGIRQMLYGNRKLTLLGKHRIRFDACARRRWPHGQSRTSIG